MLTSKLLRVTAGLCGWSLAILTSLKSAGVPCYALSNMEPDAFAIRYDRFAFMKLFDGFVISGHEGVAKPDPQIFRILLDRFALDPAATVFIEVKAGGTIGTLAPGTDRLSTSVGLKLDTSAIPLFSYTK